MTKLQALKTALKLSTCQFIDFLILPAYVNGRARLFESLGGEAPPPPLMYEGEEPGESVHNVIAQILEANLSHTVWIARASWAQGWPAEYLIMVLFPVQSDGTTTLMVGLRDRESGEDIQQAIPIADFFEHFEPKGKIQVSDLDA